MAPKHDDGLNAMRRYELKAIRKVMIGFNRNTEPELTSWIESKANKQGYIKQLVRDDMERSKK